MEKDPKLAEPVLKSLLKYWPVTNSQKEVLFIGELEEILEMTQVCPSLLPRMRCSNTTEGRGDYSGSTAALPYISHHGRRHLYTRADADTPPHSAV